MKKHVSVLGLWARLSLGKAAAVTVLMAVFEAVLFRWNLTHIWDGARDMPAMPDGTPEAVMPPDIADVLGGGVPLIFAVTGLFLLFLLSRDGSETPSAAYTLRRLSVREEAGILWKTLYNCLCLLLLWAVQAGTAVGLSCWYAASLPPEYRSGQTVFLAFYRVEFLHNLLPLDDWLRYLRNVVLLIALGFAAAVRSYKLRRGSRFGWGFVLFLCGVASAAFRFGISVWQADVFVILLALCAAVVDAQYLYQGWRGTLDED